MKVLCFYFANGANVQNLGDIFYRYTPQIAYHSNKAIFLEIEQSNKLYSEIGILKRCLAHMNQLNIQPSVAMAADAPTALAMAISKIHNKDKIPIEYLKYYAMPFRPDEFLEKESTKIIIHLIKLGIKNIQEFKNIKSQGVLSRFGSLGHLLMNNVNNAENLVWPSFKASEKVFELHEFDLEYPVENVEPLLFHLKAMIDTVYLRLRGQGKRLKRFSISMGLEHKDKDGKQRYELEMTLANGIMTPKSIFGIAKEHLYRSVQTRPLPHRVNDFRIDVLESVPYRESQKDIFNPKKEEEDESFTSLISRLRVRLGEDAVFITTPISSYIPEFNWKRNETNKEEIKSDFIPNRPLRVYKDPMKVSLMDNSLFFQGARIPITEITEREVVLSEWWNEITERIYFRVKSKFGHDYWLFRNKEGIYIHGVFD